MSIERQTSYPDYKTPLLGWYAGAYDAAYIAFHPFTRVSGLDPELCSPWTTHTYRADLPPDQDLLDSLSHIRQDREFQFSPQVVDGLIKRQGVIVPWSDIGKAVGIDSPADLNRALLTSIGAISSGYEDKAGAERLVEYCSEEKIFMPSEGRFQAPMEHRLAELFQSTGHSRIETAGQFDETSSTIELSRLQIQEPWSSIQSFPINSGRIFTADRGLLAVVDWDSFFTLICGKAECLQHIALAELFEGFWCGPDTTHYWWTQASQARSFKH